MPTPTFEERLAALRNGTSTPATAVDVPTTGSTNFEDRLLALRNSPRAQVAERKANPPAAAHGDPAGHDPSFLEQAAPYLAHPIDAISGLVSGLNPVPLLAHPVDAIKADFATRHAAFERLKARGSKLITGDPADPQSGEDLRDAYEYLVPGLGPMMANAGREMNSTDPHTVAHGFGGAVAATAGPKILENTVGAGSKAVAAKVGKIVNPPPDPIAITRAVRGGYNPHGLSAGEVLGTSGRTVDVDAVKANPQVLVDHVKGVMQHPADFIKSSLDGPDGAQTVPVKYLEQIEPPKTLLTKKADPGVLTAVKKAYNEALNAAADENGNVSMQQIHDIKRQLQARTAYEKVQGNADVVPLHDAATSSMARQLDHVVDEYVPGYALANDRLSALKGVLDDHIQPVVRSWAETPLPGGKLKAAVNAAAAVPLAATGFVNAAMNRLGRATDSLKGPLTINPTNIAEAINTQVGRYQKAGTPAWADEPVLGADGNPYEPAPKPSVREQFPLAPPPPKPAPWGSQDAQNPGFDPDVHAVSQSKAPPPVPPTSIVDALRGNTVRIPGETTVQLPDSRGSSGLQQLNDTAMNRTPATESSQLPQQNPFLAIGADQPLPDINRHLDPAFTRPTLPPMSGPGMQPSSGGTRFTGLPEGGTVDTHAAYDRLPDNHPAAPNPGFNPDQLSLKEPVLPTKRNMTIMDALRPAGQSAPAGEHAVSLAGSEGSAAAGQLGGPAAGQPATPNTTTTGTPDHLSSVLTKPSVAESHASALSLSHPASLDSDVQAAILSGTAEYVDPRGRVIRIPAPDLLPH